MPFVQRLVLSFPSVVLGAIIVGIYASLAIAGLVLVRRCFNHEQLRLHHDVAEPMLDTFAVAYTVLMAFVVVIVWQAYDRSDLNVTREANCLVDLYRNSESFQEPQKQQIRNFLSAYSQAVVNDEWRTMQRGQSSPQVQEIIDKMGLAYSRYLPKTINEQVFFTASVNKLNELNELRRQRLLDSRTGMHPVLWFVLVLGGIVTIIFTFFFSSKNFIPQLFMVALLATMIGLILFTILMFDFPFTGNISISPEPFKLMLKY